MAYKGSLEWLRAEGYEYEIEREIDHDYGEIQKMRLTPTKKGCTENNAILRHTDIIRLKRQGWVITNIHVLDGNTVVELMHRGF